MISSFLYLSTSLSFYWTFVWVCRVMNFYLFVFCAQTRILRSWIRCLLCGDLDGLIWEAMSFHISGTNFIHTQSPALASPLNLSSSKTQFIIHFSSWSPVGEWGTVQPNRLSLEEACLSPNKIWWWVSWKRE